MSWSVLNTERNNTQGHRNTEHSVLVNFVIDNWCRTNKFWSWSLWDRRCTYPWRWGMSWPIVISCATFWYRSWLLSTIDSRMARDLCSTAESVDDLHTKLAICSGNMKRLKSWSWVTHKRKKGSSRVKPLYDFRNRIYVGIAWCVQLNPRI